MEYMLAYQQRVAPYRERLKAAPWASLVIMGGIPMSSPEVVTLMVDAIKIAKTINLLATAVVFEEVGFSATAKNFWQDIYQQAGLEHQFFENEKDALQWLTAQVSAAH